MSKKARPSKKRFYVLGLILATVVAGGLAFVLSGPKNSTSGGKLEVVAAENFWGSLVAQIGGDKIKVTDIVSDPDADPHEYESSSANAREFASANYVILNGAGYDSWGDKMLNANPNSNRKELKVADLLGKKDGDNPHFWYNPAYVNQMTNKMEQDLATIDPGNAIYFNSQLKSLQSSLANSYQDKFAQIKQQHADTQVAATEDIFVYLADTAGLKLVSPPDFIEAVAEGNDPPAAAITQFEQQLKSGRVKVLLYNQQTITPLTQNMKKIAQAEHIPVVGMTETVQPQNIRFQDWMGTQITNLQNALNARALGQ